MQSWWCNVTVVKWMRYLSFTWFTYSCFAAVCNKSVLTWNGQIKKTVIVPDQVNHEYTVYAYLSPHYHYQGWQKDILSLSGPMFTYRWTTSMNIHQCSRRSPTKPLLSRERSMTASWRWKQSTLTAHSSLAKSAIMRSLHRMCPSLLTKMVGTSSQCPLVKELHA